MIEWQPIDTAPKDGTVVLALTVEAQNPSARVSWFEGGEWLRVWKPEKFVVAGPTGWWPTHWMPLPDTSMSSKTLVYPETLTDDLRRALSTMLWNCGSIARLLRLYGEVIKERAEDEQAHVLHWLTVLVLRYGESWPGVADARLKAISERAKTEAAS